MAEQAVLGAREQQLEAELAELRRKRDELDGRARQLRAATQPGQQQQQQQQQQQPGVEVQLPQMMQPQKPALAPQPVHAPRKRKASQLPQQPTAKRQSTYHGVYWKSSRWTAKFRVGKQRTAYSLGYFDDEKQAARAYDM